MTNRGALDGLGPGLWQKYEPTIRGFHASTSPTQPSLGTDSTVYGEYWSNGQGRVMCRGAIQFGSTATYGSGESVWGVSLPVPANRSSGGADLPIGNAWLWQGSAADPQLNMQSIPTLMDPLAGGGGNQTNEDNYFQLFIPYMVSYGTGSFASSATSATVTHGLAVTPVAYDITVVPTNNPSSTPKTIWIDTITSTQFNVNITTASTTTPMTFSWKARAECNSTANFSLLASSLKPWVWASGHVISWQIEYEARR